MSCSEWTGDRDKEGLAINAEVESAGGTTVQTHILLHLYAYTQQTERRRPVEPPKSPRPTPELAEPFFFSQAFEALPLALLVSIPDRDQPSQEQQPGVLIKNAAYRAAFGDGGEKKKAVDDYFRGCVLLVWQLGFHERQSVDLI